MTMKIFLRNDDVRDQLDESLIYLTEQVVGNGLVISHAVEPVNVTNAVVEWLLDKTLEYPDRIEIIQHGCDHQLKTAPPVRGEFGGGRLFEEQRDEILRGADMMDGFFGDRWTRIFSFPYGAYDMNTLRALEECQFKVISTGVRFTRKRKLINGVGHLLRRKSLFGRNIVYFNEPVPGFEGMREIPVVLNNTKKQTGPDSALQYSVDELEAKWKSLPEWLKVRGMLCHHRFNSREDIDQLIQFMCRLRDSGVKVSKIGDIHA